MQCGATLGVDRVKVTANLRVKLKEEQVSVQCGLEKIRGVTRVFPSRNAEQLVAPVAARLAFPDKRPFPERRHKLFGHLPLRSVRLGMVVEETPITRRLDGPTIPQVGIFGLEQQRLFHGFLAQLHEAGANLRRSCAIAVECARRVPSGRPGRLGAARSWAAEGWRGRRRVGRRGQRRERRRSRGRAADHCCLHTRRSHWALGGARPDAASAGELAQALEQRTDAFVHLLLPLHRTPEIHFRQFEFSPFSAAGRLKHHLRGRASAGGNALRRSLNRVAASHVFVQREKARTSITTGKGRRMRQFGC
mmetsp:Transcript_15785/g.43139  ORF Transcript_15785/g.43139 Transcript_15785/m.43139 type:complete len:306 (+) Transcript_15785:771-1688(+)